MYIQLTERQQKILWATIHHYIETAEPVGSQAIAKEYAFSLSPATIRNVMGLLEKEGLLYQPHTSAGRIPSDSGYRVYVDKLITPSEQLAAQVKQLLGRRLQSEPASFETLLRHAAQLLATLSGCVSLITMPQSPTTILRHLHLVQVDRHRVMLIVVTDTYETRSVFMDLPTPLEATEAPEGLEQELQLLSNFLNHHLGGKSLSELSTMDWQELDRQFQKFASFLTQLCQELSQQNYSTLSNPVLIGGVSEFLRQPEFAELSQAQTIIQMLEEEQSPLWSLIQEGIEVRQSTPSGHPPKPPVRIRIGTENNLKPIQNCALISSVYRKGKLPVGSVGVLGPTRLAYDRVIAAVEGTAEFLSARLSQTP